MKQKNLSLAFFADRLHVKPEQLSYTIGKVVHENGSVYRFPALKIQGKFSLFDIREDRLVRIGKHEDGSRIFCTPTSVTIKNGDVFMVDKMHKELVLTQNEFARKYFDKVVSDETI